MTRGSRSSADRPRAVPGLSRPVLRAIEAHLARREARRARLHDEARALRRRAQGIMIRLHQGGGAARELRGLRAATRSLARRVRSEAAPDAPVARDALQEAVEALLLDAALRGEVFPSPWDLGVDVEPYLLGLGDVVGELRRRALTDLAKDRIEDAERWVQVMEGLYQTLMRFDTTRAIVPLKPKQDVARSLVERTRGEVAIARVHARHLTALAPERGERP